MVEIAAGFIALADVFANRVSQVGINVISDAIQATTTAYTQQFNRLIAVLTRDLADNTKVQERYRLPATGTLQPVDEWGRPLPVKGELYYTQAYPLFMGAYAWGTNWVALEKLTVAEANEHTLAALRADADWNIRRMLAPLFYNQAWTFNDPEHGALTIKPLANGEADVKFLTRTGQIVTANHYLAQANVIDANNNPFPVIVRTLRQYPANGNGPIITYIHNDQRASIEALAGFVPVSDPDVTVGVGSDRLANNGPTDHLGDELLGKVNGTWIVEWGRIPSGYMLSHVHGTPVLARRQQPEAALQGLIRREVVEGGITSFEFYRHAGYAPRNRVAALVTRIGNATYAPPSGYDSLPLAV